MDIKITILALIRDSQLAIVNFQEQLLGIKKDYELATAEESDLLDQIAEDIYFIVGTMTTHRLYLEQILTHIEKDCHYYINNQKEIDSFIQRITQFNQEYLLKS